VSDQSVAIGVTAVPTPLTDLGSDLWFFHQMLMGGIMKDSSAGFASLRGFRYVVDSKAMRKVEEGQDIVFCSENTNILSGASILVGGRMLIKMN